MQLIRRTAYYRVYWTRDSMVAVACLTPVLRWKMAQAIRVQDDRNERDLPRLAPEAVEIAADFTKAVVARMLQEDHRGVDPGIRRRRRARRPGAAHHRAGRGSAGPGQRAEGGAETPLRATSALPTLGQHDDEILGEFGHGPEEVQRLRANGVIR